MVESAIGAEARELEQFARSVNINDVLISVRCFFIAQSEGRSRYEIVIEGCGEVAVVDVAASRESTLPARIDEAVRGFAAALALRKSRR